MIPIPDTPSSRRKLRLPSLCFFPSHTDLILRCSPFLALISRLILGGVFLFSALTKLPNPYFFLNSLYQYQLLPPFLAHFIAMILPWLELLLGLLLLTGTWLKGTWLPTLVLLMTFLSLHAYVLLRGLQIPCGCFGTLIPGNIPPASLALTLLLLALALLGAGARSYLPRTRSPRS